MEADLLSDVIVFSILTQCSFMDSRSGCLFASVVLSGPSLALHGRMDSISSIVR